MQIGPFESEINLYSGLTLKGGTICIENSKYEKRHSNVMKAIPVFLTKVLKKIYLDHTLMMFL